ncbi:MAG: hypothetical protein AB8E15_06635 [Bdellovibrionales bacterium]
MKQLNIIRNLLLSLTIVSLTAACDLGGLSATGSKTDGPGKTGTIDQEDRQNLESLTSVIAGGEHSNMEALFIDLETEELVIRMPLPLPFGKVKTGNLGGKEDISYEIRRVQYDGDKTTWALQLRIPLANLVKNKFKDYPSNQLPTSYPILDSCAIWGSECEYTYDLPGVATGELPMLGLTWDEDNDFYLYLGGGNIAVFIPTGSFDPYFYIAQPLWDNEQNVTGYFALIPENKDKDEEPGLYMAGILPPEIAKWIDDNY